MVRIDFSPYGYEFESCPIWWQNFVTATIKVTIGEDALAYTPDDVWDTILSKALAENSVIIVNQPNSFCIDYLEFECEEDLVMFKLRWS